METIELRELEVFLTLADECHFGRSAERLGVTQSRVSQSLRELERKLGGPLLYRTSRRVTITPLGERFRAEVAPAYEKLAGVLQRAQAANRSLEGTLRLGLLYPTAGGPHLTAIIQAFEQRYPGCEVQQREVLLHDPLGPLRRGEIDVMATRLPLERSDIVVGPILAREARVLQVARDHPLATRAQVSVEDLADYHVAPLSGFPAETIEAVVPRATPSGRPIRRRRLRQTPRTPFEFEALIARGVIVHPTVGSFAVYFAHPDLVSVPISDLPPADSGLVWRRHAATPRLRAFVQVTRDILAAADPATDR